MNNQIDKLVQDQSDSEPFSGNIYINELNGDNLFKQSYGFAIRSEKIPNEKTTRFQTASGSKIFTSIAICKLIEEKLLKLDSRLLETLDYNFRNFDQGITINQLLTHSSGITSYFEEDIDPDYEKLWQKYPMYTIRSPKDFLPLFQHKKMKFSPGTRFEYNDGGFILLGMIIEKITGEAFDKFIQKSVFSPAKMKDSGYFATDQLPKGSAYAYIQNPDGQWRTNFFAVPIIGAPDGGAYTTVLDMTVFWKALLNDQLLSKEMTEALMTAQIITGWDAPYTHYGYGVWIEKLGSSIQKYFVEGYDPGVSFRSAYYPELDVIFTMIGNTSNALWPLYQEIEEILLND